MRGSISKQIQGSRRAPSLSLSSQIPLSLSPTSKNVATLETKDTPASQREKAPSSVLSHSVLTNANATAMCTLSGATDYAGGGAISPVDKPSPLVASEGEDKTTSRQSEPTGVGGTEPTAQAERSEPGFRSTHYLVRSSHGYLVLPEKVGLYSFPGTLQGSKATATRFIHPYLARRCAKASGLRSFYIEVETI